MNYQDYLFDALEMVLAWDIPEEELAVAVNDQARLMAGIFPDESPGEFTDTPFHSFCN